MLYCPEETVALVISSELSTDLKGVSITDVKFLTYLLKTLHC